MNRLLVALLAAFDAVIAVAVGVAAALAPMTLVWAIGLGGDADWGALWPAAVRLWQLGHLVPVELTLPQDYTVAAQVAPDAVTFSLSLAPLVFAVFTAVFGVRSGARAAGAGAWVTGVLSGTATFAALTAVLAVTAATPFATVATWQAIILPVAVFVVGVLSGALTRAWRDGDDGVVDSVFVRLDRIPSGTAVVAASARAVGIAAAGFVAVGAAAFTVALVARGGEVVALYQAANVDAVGATVVTLAQAAYLPTLIVWAASFAAGPGFAVGAGSNVAASGTNAGVLPGVPILGAIPPSSTAALLLLALLLVAVGVMSGLAARRRLDAAPGAPTRAAGDAARAADEATLPRVIALTVTVVGAGLFAALCAWLASGSFGPGRLAESGPLPGPLALAVAAEVGVGAAIALLAPRPRSRARAEGADAPRVE